MNKFGEFLYQLRKEKGMTQSELADKLNITNKAVSKWETGESYPETAQLLPLSKVFNITIDELLNGEKNNNINDEDRIVENTVVTRPYSAKESFLIGFGVFFIIIGVIMLITFEVTLSTKYVNAISVGSLLLTVAISVVIFMLTGFKRRLKSVELSEEKEKSGMRYALLLALGVALLIISPGIFIFVTTAIESILSIVVLLGLVAIAILIIIPSGIGWENFIKANNIPADDDSNLEGPQKKLNDAICGALMLIATAVFLILGFLYNMWHPGWVVFPIGGILCGIVSTIIGGVNHEHRNRHK